MSAFEVESLTKAYGPKRAVDGISFDVPRGEVFCLLGPNGAGKTTTVEILEGFRVRDGGSVRVLGHDPGTRSRDFLDRIGIVHQSCGLPDDLTVREVLTTYSRYYRRPRPVPSLLALVGLVDSEAVRIKRLSGGQRRRLEFALALAGDPEVLFLDEPTTGFDPSARRAAWETVANLRTQGVTVLLTTHFMDEAQHLADRVAVLVDGRIASIGSPDEIGGRDRAPSEIRFTLPAELAPADLPALEDAQVSVDGTGVRVLAGDGPAAAAVLSGWARERGVTLRGFTMSQPSLEDAYLSLTSNGGGGDD